MSSYGADCVECVDGRAFIVRCDEQPPHNLLLFYFEHTRQSLLTALWR